MYRAVLLSILLIPFAAGLVSAQSNSGKVFWKGMVDDKVQLTIRGTDVRSKVISGKAQPEGVFSFTAPLPSAAVTAQVLRKEGGDGDVKVIQQPAASNGFTAIVEIYDNDGGANDYLLEIGWN